MKKILLQIFLGLSILTKSLACYNDSESRYYERYAMPTDIQLSSGDFPTHSKYYFEWKIKNRLEQIKNDKKNLDLYDDLAVAYEKSGQAEKAIAVMLDVLKKNPERYSALSNIGTFYVHLGDYTNGLKYLNKAIEINPKAHFERERYQIKAVEYIQLINAKPPFIFPVQNIKSGKDFADFVLKGINNKDEQEKELVHAIVGISGMIKFGMKNSSLLMEMMGDLYLKIMIINKWSDPLAIKSYHYLVLNYYTTALKLSKYSENNKPSLYDFIDKKSLGYIDNQHISYIENNYYHNFDDNFEKEEKEIIENNPINANIEEIINEKLYPGKQINEKGQTRDLFNEKKEEIEKIKKEYKNQIIENDNIKRKIYNYTTEQKLQIFFPLALIFLLFGYIYEGYLFFSEKKLYVNKKAPTIRVYTGLITIIFSLVITGEILFFTYSGIISQTLISTFMIILVLSIFVSFIFGIPIIHYKNEDEKKYYKSLKIYKAVKYSSWVIKAFVIFPILLYIFHYIIKQFL